LHPVPKTTYRFDLRQKTAPQKTAPLNFCTPGSRIFMLFPSTDYNRKGFLRSIKRHTRPGLYPALYLSGIHDHCSPASGAEISMMSVILSTFEEARRILEERGLVTDVKTIRKITLRFARRAEAMLKTDKNIINVTLAGSRVVVSVDGGRIRIRQK